MGVFGVAPDASVCHKFYTGCDWQPAKGFENMNGICASGPTAISWGPNRLDYFVLGTSSVAYHKCWDGTAWQPTTKYHEELKGKFTQLNFSLPSTRVHHIIATMASKFMASKFTANAALESRLLLRPSHQRAVWTVNKLEWPIPGRPTLPPILSSRLYSDSTSTPTPPFPESPGSTSTSPFPKSSGSTEGSQSSGPEDKTYSNSTSTRTPPFPKSSRSTEGSQSSGPEDKKWFDPNVRVKSVDALAAALFSLGIVRAGSFLCHLKHADYQRVLPYLPPRTFGKIGTRHIRDVDTNLHANLQSTISLKRDRYSRRQLKTLSHANPLSRK